MRRRRPAPRRSAHKLLRWESLGHAVTGLESLEQRQLLAADLVITLSDDLVAGVERQYYTPGSQVVYTLKVTNNGDTAATGARLTTSLAPAITQATWTAAYSSGTKGDLTYDDTSVSPTVPRPVANVRAGMGNLDMDLTVAAGGTATFTIIATVGAAATGNLVSNAQVVLGDVTRSATDTDQFVPRSIAVTSDAGWTSDSLVRLVDPATGATLAQVFAFEPGLKTGVRTAMGDLDCDGKAEIICTPGRGRLGEVVVLRQDVDGSGNVTLVKDASYGSLVPFAGHRRGLEVVTGDFNGDGADDVAVAKSGDTAISVLRAVPLGLQRLVVDRTFTIPQAAGPAGVSLAAGDFGTFSEGVETPNAGPDGRVELVVSSRGGVAPIVTIVDMSPVTPVVVDEINPFTNDFLGGVSVMVARIGRDSIPDIVIAQGRGGGSEVEVYDGQASKPLIAAFTAFADLGSAAAVRTAAVDDDGDGRADRIVAVQAGTDATGLRSFAVNTAEASGAITITQSSSAANAASRLRVAAAALRNATSLVTTDSGLQFIDLEPGTGAVLGNKKVTVDYTGTYNPTAGSLGPKVFDSSKAAKRGNAPSPFQFTIGKNEVIDGWDEGVATMKTGSIRQLIVPTRLAYSAGNLAGKTLAFEVQVKSAP